MSLRLEGRLSSIADINVHLASLHENKKLMPSISVGGNLAGNADNQQNQYDNASSAPVPEPSTFLLFGAGLAGVAFLRRRAKK